MIAYLWMTTLSNLRYADDTTSIVAIEPEMHALLSRMKRDCEDLELKMELGHASIWLKVICLMLWEHLKKDKIKLVQTLILPILQYGVESWTLKAADCK